MKHPSAFLASLVLLSGPVWSQLDPLGDEIHPTDDSSKITVELALRVGTLGGQIVNIENRLYEDYGLVVVDKAGKESPTNPAGSMVGFELDALYSLDPSFQLGLALLSQNVSIQPEGATESKFEADFLTEQAVLARVRFRPLHFRNMKFGIEAGLGPCTGSLHRYALAAKNIPLLTTGLSTLDASERETYLQTGNRSVEVSGLRYEASLLMTRAFTPRIGVDLRMGFHRSSHTIKGTDPLDGFERKYPSSVSSIGLDLSLGLVGTF
jgi:hypothetical protein